MSYVEVMRRSVDLARTHLQQLDDDVIMGDLSLMVEPIIAAPLIIWCGVGKSGHVAAKAASTLRSFGRPSVYINAAEAAHGDLGLFSPRSVVIALSHSGETAELMPIIANHSARLFAITSNPDSTLARHSHAVAYGSVVEACPVGAAPTTSTLVAMALCDALCVAVAAKMGITSEDFQSFHPGGSLGASLKPVRDVMHSSYAVVEEDTPITEVARAMGSTDHKGACVVRGKHGYVGIITDGDLRRALGGMCKPFDLKAFSFMTRNPRYCYPNDTVSETAATMQANRVTTMLVKDGLSITGLVHLHDCLGVDKR